MIPVARLSRLVLESNVVVVVVSELLTQRLNGRVFDNACFCLAAAKIAKSQSHRHKNRRYFTKTNWNRLFPHFTQVRTKNRTRARQGWTFSYVSCIFVRPELEVGMRERSTALKSRLKHRWQKFSLFFDQNKKVYFQITILFTVWIEPVPLLVIKTFQKKVGTEIPTHISRTNRNNSTLLVWPALYS